MESTRISSNPNELQTSPNESNLISFRIPELNDKSQMQTKNIIDHQINLAHIKPGSPTPPLKTRVQANAEDSNSNLIDPKLQRPNNMIQMPTRNINPKQSTSPDSNKRFTNSQSTEKQHQNPSAELEMTHSDPNTQSAGEQDFSILHMKCHPQGQGPKFAYHNINRQDSKITFIEKYSKLNPPSKMPFFMKNDFSFCNNQGKNLQINDIIKLNEELLNKTLEQCPQSPRGLTVSKSPHIPIKRNVAPSFKKRTKRQISQEKKISKAQNHIYVSSNSKISCEPFSSLSGHISDETFPPKDRNLTPESTHSHPKPATLPQNANNQSNNPNLVKVMTPINISTIKHSENGQNTVICHVEVQKHDMEKSVDFQITKADNQRKIMIVTRNDKTVSRSVSPHNRKDLNNTQGLQIPKIIPQSQNNDQLSKLNSQKNNFSMPRQKLTQQPHSIKPIIPKINSHQPGKKMDTDQLFEHIMLKNQLIVQQNSHHPQPPLVINKKINFVRDESVLKSLQRHNGNGPSVGIKRSHSNFRKPRRHS